MGPGFHVLNSVNVWSYLNGSLEYFHLWRNPMGLGSKLWALLLAFCSESELLSWPDLAIESILGPLPDAS